LFFGDHLFKLVDVLEVWNELNGITAAVKSTGPYHSHVTHCIACNRYQDASADPSAVAVSRIRRIFNAAENPPKNN